MNTIKNSADVGAMSIANLNANAVEAGSRIASAGTIGDGDTWEAIIETMIAACNAWWNSSATWYPVKEFLDGLRANFEWDTLVSLYPPVIALQPNATSVVSLWKGINDFIYSLKNNYNLPPVAAGIYSDTHQVRVVIVDLYNQAVAVQNLIEKSNAALSAWALKRSRFLEAEQLAAAKIQEALTGSVNKLNNDVSELTDIIEVVVTNSTSLPEDVKKTLLNRLDALQQSRKDMRDQLAATMGLIQAQVVRLETGASGDIINPIVPAAAKNPYLSFAVAGGVGLVGLLLRRGRAL